MEYGRLKGLKVEDYQHEGENIYMKMMKSIPLYDKAMKAALRAAIDVGSTAEAAGDWCRVNEKTNPHVYNLYLKALERLDMSEEFPLYSKLDFEYNAAAYSDRFIVIHTSLLNDLTDDEVLSVIGHEIGHIKSGHGIYTNIARNILNIISSLGAVGMAAGSSLAYTVTQWSRCAEYTCDRAGVIASGSPEAGMRVQAKLMSATNRLPHVHIDVNKLLAQTDNLKMEVDDTAGKILYAYYTMQQDHPWSPLRIRELYEWDQSGEYQKIIEKYA